MLNNLGNVSLYLISMANIARFLGFFYTWFVLLTETTFFKSFCLVWDWKGCFLLFLVCGERRNRVSWFPRGELGGETRFLIDLIFSSLMHSGFHP